MGINNRRIKQQRLRLAHGLRWEREYPPPPKYPNLVSIMLVVVIIGLWALVMTLDYNALHVR